MIWAGQDWLRKGLQTDIVLNWDGQQALWISEWISGWISEWMNVQHYCYVFHAVGTLELELQPLV